MEEDWIALFLFDLLRSSQERLGPLKSVTWQRLSKGAFHSISWAMCGKPGIAVSDSRAGTTLGLNWQGRQNLDVCLRTPLRCYRFQTRNINGPRWPLKEENERRSPFFPHCAEPLPSFPLIKHSWRQTRLVSQGRKQIWEGKRVDKERQGRLIAPTWTSAEC